MTSEELFSVDLTGQRLAFDDLLADGLDHDYSARFPALRELLAGGSAREQLQAAAMLAAWGHRDGYLAIIGWAEQPKTVPWASAPLAAPFATLAHALAVAEDAKPTETAALLRVGAARALLLAYDREFFDRELYVLFDLDRALAARAKLEMEWAIEHAIGAARLKSPPFDAACQAAFMLGPFARLDDAKAATLATLLLATQGTNERCLREVALAMASGTGPATLGILDQLAKSGLPGVAREAREHLAKRGELS